MGEDSFFKKMNEYGKGKTPFLFICDFELKHPLIYKLDEVPEDHILYDINGITNVREDLFSNKKLVFEKKPVEFSKYAKAFDIVQHHLRRGDTYLLNLTLPTPVSTNYSIKEIFYNSRAKYRLWIKDKLVVFSPEVFVQIKNGRISSHPMKGTIDAKIPDAENIILNDEKERAEHVTIVDLIRNDLNRVSKKVKVEKYRYIDHLTSNDKDLLQVSSEVSGELPSNYFEQIGDILQELLPAGSISGAPKKKTVEVIKNAEGYERGYYTGVFGYFDGMNVDCGVMIRYIEQTEKGLIYKSGGGITLRSKVETEYKELIDKVYVPVIRND